MSESKEYVSQTLEHGAIHISEEVIATIAALAIQDVEGVYGLNTSIAAIFKLSFGTKSLAACSCD